MGTAGTGDNNMAAAAVPLAIQIGTTLGKLGLTALTQHTARLKNATDENASLDAVIPAFDADIAAISDAFSTGQADLATCISACYAVDTNIFNYLYSLATSKKPGVSWNGPTTQSLGSGNRPVYTIVCNKACTASCCVYLNDLRPAIFGRGGLGTSYQPWQTSSGVVLGLIEIMQKGGGVLKVITVFPPPNKAYGSYSRPGYNITVSHPPVQSAIKNTVKQMLGGGGLTLPDGTVVPPASGTVASSPVSTKKKKKKNPNISVPK